MTDLITRVISALRFNHDVLVGIVPDLGPGQLNGPSGAAEWSIAQVLSHLGSGAEISRKPIARAAGLEVDDESNESIWERWDSSSPHEQAAGFVTHDTEYLETVESLTPEQRESLMVDLGFLPEPVPLLVALGMRLGEVANHAWDVRVGLDPSAEIDDESAAVLVELFQGPLAFLLGFSAKPDQVSEPVRLVVPGAGIRIDGGVTVVGEVTEPTATLDGPAGAVPRLLTGRLRSPYDEGVAVSGNVTLDELRKVFPGY